MLASKTSINTSSFSKNSILFFFAKVICFFFSFFSSVILARILGPAGKGALSLIVLIPMFAFTFVSLGIHQANVYFIGQYKDKLRPVISNCTFFALAAGGVLTIIVWVLRSRISTWLSLMPYASAVAWSCLLFPLVLANNFYINILTGQKRFMERNISEIVNSTLRLILVVLLVYLLKNGVVGGILAVIIAMSAATLYSFVNIARKNVPSFSTIDPGLFKETVSYGFKSQLGNMFQIFNYRLDMFFVNYFLGISSVGTYSVAVCIGELLWYIPTVTGTILFPVVSSDFQKYDDRYISSVCKRTSILTVSGACAILLTSWFLIPFIFGKEFVSSIKPLLILLPGIVAIGIHKVLIFALMGKGYPQYMSHSSFITLIVTVVLDLILIPSMGVPGAALASTLAYITCAAYTSYRYTKTTELSWNEIVIPGKEDFLYYWNYGKKAIKKQ